MLGSQEKNLEPKVNVKFFTVDPYTPCNKVSRPFPIWSIWQITITTLTNAMMPTVNDEYGNKFELIITVKLLLLPLDTVLALC